MKKYKILPHTAELRLKIYGKTIEGLFQNAVFAINRILKKDADKQKCENLANAEKIKIESININSLLVDFLNEILLKIQINKALYFVKNIKHKELKNKALLEAEITTCLVNEFDEDIKAITHHNVNIKKNYKGILETELIIDI